MLQRIVQGIFGGILTGLLISLGVLLFCAPIVYMIKYIENPLYVVGGIGLYVSSILGLIIEFTENRGKDAK